MDYLENALIKKIDDFIIEGLKRKGYSFNNRIDLEQFIKSRCRYEHNPGTKQRLYFVNNVPFILHNYSVEHDFIIETENGITLKVCLGGFEYL